VRILRLVLPVLALVGLAVVVPTQSQATPAHYYVALGDSLSKGYMPGTGDTDKGYVNDLFTTLHNRDHSLILKQFGCSGETTGSMINGGICTYPLGSQLKQAVDFLSHNQADVKYLTLDIGANDVDSCATGGSIDFACVGKGLTTIAQNIATILPALATADGRKPFSVGMTYYDPFLSQWLSGTTGKAVATASVPLAYTLNAELGVAFVASGFHIADVGGAFQTANFTGRAIVLPYGILPTNVANICRYTFMCSQNNIHATVGGYAFIASVFARVIH
jgi:lysophospholipase L1-like esterase